MFCSPPYEQADYVSSPIKRFTERGIETEDGKHYELDIVFCATGSYFTLRFMEC